jgi:hypothetical protein|tara:strand:- start:2323 stop:2835 length:513 start_codon:yes stop_codon:yes gene_type:complete
MFKHQTLYEARADLEESKLAGNMSFCPCCDQHVKVYARRISYTMCRQLEMLRQLNKPLTNEQLQIKRRIGDAGKLRYWGLIKENTDEKYKRWEITDLGRNFLLGKVAIPRTAYVFDSKCIKLDGEATYIHHCLGQFSIEDLMKPFDTPISLVPLMQKTKDSLAQLPSSFL